MDRKITAMEHKLATPKSPNTETNARRSQGQTNLAKYGGPIKSVFFLSFFFFFLNGILFTA